MNKFKIISYLAASMLSLASGAASATHAQADVGRHFYNWSIVGAWEVVVTLRVSTPNCATAAIVGFGPNPFPSFNTFHLGGTMSEFGTRSAARGSGHGIWKRVGSNTFKYRNMFHSFDANGLFFRTANTLADVTLEEDGQTLTGVARLTFTDLSGNTLNFCATLAGTRITL